MTATDTALYTLYSASRRMQVLVKAALRRHAAGKAPKRKKKEVPRHFEDFQLHELHNFKEKTSSAEHRVHSLADFFFLFL